MNNRKVIVCSRCNKKKQHFGKGMCSACLRRTKRENNPNFYLGTCYSEMTRRVKTKTKLRPNYYGMSICTKQEFVSKFIKDLNFLSQFKQWQKSGHQRISAPSIDRIDNNKGYNIDNLQFISHSINSKKDLFQEVIIKGFSVTRVFKSNKEAAGFIGVTPSYFCRCKKDNKLCRGYRIYE